jgi:S1-C subfamily serine protease
MQQSAARGAAASTAPIQPPQLPAAQATMPRGYGVPLLLVGLVLGLSLSLLPARSGGTPSPAATQRTLPEGAASISVRTSAPEPPEPPGEAPPADDPPDTAPKEAAPDTLEDLVSRVLPAVASVQSGSSRGTGFFIAPDQVLTNDHVVAGESSVRLQIGELSYQARVVATSPAIDLAVLKVFSANPSQPFLTLARSPSPRVGQEVIAVGSALGVLSNTVTRGIVSAVRRVGHVTLIQTDAAINPGNSGGPLVDRTGQVIGVNSLRVAQRAEGVAFAVAIDHAVQLLSGQLNAGTSTPLRSLTSMLGEPSGGDQQRVSGEQELSRVLVWAERNSDELDGYWNRYSSTCVAGASTAGDRAWFSVYDPNGVRLGTAAAVDCSSWLDNVRRNATEIRVQVQKASELARRSGVYPGTVRDLFQRHRLRWAGWER